MPWDAWDVAALQPQAPHAAPNLRIVPKVCRKTSSMQNTLTFINEDQAEVITCRILLVDISECRCQIEASEEKTDRNGFTLA